MPSARRACGWLLGWNRRPGREEDDRARAFRRRFVTALCRLDAGIAVARRLGQEFLGLLARHRDGAMFDRWLARLRACAVPELRRFAAGLTVDHEAVRAAVVMPWSSGQVEGQINPLKLPKRSMYGRARLDLLRIRILHPNRASFAHVTRNLEEPARGRTTPARHASVATPLRCRRTCGSRR